MVRTLERTIALSRVVNRTEAMAAHVRERREPAIEVVNQYLLASDGGHHEVVVVRDVALHRDEMPVAQKQSLAFGRKDARVQVLVPADLGHRMAFSAHERVGMHVRRPRASLYRDALRQIPRLSTSVPR